MSVNKDPIDVDEVIAQVVKPTEAKDVKEFIKELDELYNQNCHKNYDRFAVSLVKNPKGVDISLCFVGYRRENDEETKKRVAIEEEKDKRNKAAELKEYLRLKKIYGRKGEEE